MHRLAHCTTSICMQVRDRLDTSQLPDSPSLPDISAIRVEQILPTEKVHKILLYPTSPSWSAVWLSCQSNKTVGPKEASGLDEHSASWSLVLAVLTIFSDYIIPVVINNNYCHRQILQQLTQLHDKVQKSQHLHPLTGGCSPNALLQLSFRLQWSHICCVTLVPAMSIAP